MFNIKNKNYVNYLCILGIVGTCTYVWMLYKTGCGIRSRAEDIHAYAEGRHRSLSVYENFKIHPAHIKPKDKSAR